MYPNTRAYVKKKQLALNRRCIVVLEKIEEDPAPTLAPTRTPDSLQVSNEEQRHVQNQFSTPRSRPNHMSYPRRLFHNSENNRFQPSPNQSSTRTVPIVRHLTNSPESDSSRSFARHRDCRCTCGGCCFRHFRPSSPLNFRSSRSPIKTDVSSSQIGSSTIELHPHSSPSSVKSDVTSPESWISPPCNRPGKWSSSDETPPDSPMSNTYVYQSQQPGPSSVMWSSSMLPSPQSEPPNITSFIPCDQLSILDAVGIDIDLDDLDDLPITPDEIIQNTIDYMKQECPSPFIFMDDDL